MFGQTAGVIHPLQNKDKSSCVSIYVSKNLLLQLPQNKVCPHLGHGPSNILWQRATRVIVGWLAGRTWKNISKSHTYRPEVL
jgi:hypothetical protein